MSVRRACLALGLSVAIHFSQSSPAQISKGNQILLSRSFQIQGMIVNYDNFHLSTYSNANYTSINWLWDSNPSLHGPAPGFPWARWVRNQSEMPPVGSEGSYLSQIVTLQIGDEADLNNPAVRDGVVNWFSAIRANWPNTILYVNNYGGQVSDAALADFYTRAQPDMLCFDTYPWKSVYLGVGIPPGAPIAGPPITWYSDLRRYREHAKGAGIPLSTYRQTFHAIQDYDRTVYRDPSPSELRLNTFAALAFNAKALIDFTYNTGASSLFTAPGGDSNPNALYYEHSDANLRARNLGKALIRLKPIDDVPFPDLHTTSMMFIRGTNSPPAPNPLPIGFIPDDALPNTISDWVSDRNDPYLRGWVVTNKAGVKNGGRRGDVIISWFTPLDESFDGPTYSNQIYFMVVNGLSDPTGTAADCLQEVRLNFLNTFTSVDIFDPVTDQVQTQALPIVSTRRQLVLNLNGGDAALFKISNGAPFVGVTLIAPRLGLDIQGGARAISIQGAIGSRYRLEAAIALPTNNWIVLTNLVLPTSPYTLLDTASASSGARFYRGVAVP